MCNLYDLTTNQEAMRRIFGILPDLDRLGNFEPPGRVYPDKDCAVVRQTAAGRELVRMRWGFPPPPPRPGTKAVTKPVTNVRNLTSSHWRHWLNTPAQRCLVPLSAFAEPHPTRKDARGWVDNEWFHLPGAELFAFAGIWRPWTGERSIGNRRKEQREWELFAFLTCTPNELVAPIHPKAMPVILRPEDWSTWLEAPWTEAARLACAYDHGAMAILAATEPARPDLVDA